MLSARLAGLWRRWFGRPGAAPEGVGSRGERAAELFLCREKHFTVRDRNWKHRRDELDLVCQDGAILVFVEVKTRAAHAKVAGYHAVDRRKKKALLRACRAYIAQMVVRPRTFRFDIVELEHVDGEITAIRHFENVPLFSKAYRRGG